MKYKNGSHKIKYHLYLESISMTDTKITVRKQLTAIDTFDWIVYTQATPAELDKLVENSKFIIIWTKRIAVHQIKNYDIEKVWDIEFFILSQPKDIQRLLRDRENEKYGLVWKRFESVEEIQNYLSKKSVPWYTQKQ